MIHFLQLIRYKNLLIIAATQYLMRYAVIKPILDYKYAKIFGRELYLQFSDLNFFLLVLATIMITAAGYVINDYFDRKTDLFNRPDTVIVGKHIKRRTAMTMHWVFNIAAAVIGFYISHQIGIFNLGTIFLFTIGLLWYYSTSFSKQLLIGNILVALLTASVPLLVGLYDLIPIYKAYQKYLIYFQLEAHYILFWILGFSYFAFVSTLSREIVKDMEDLEGDNAYGRKTLPVVAGMKTAKIAVVLTQAILMGSLIVASTLYVNDIISQIYLWAQVLINGLIAVKAYKANAVKDFHTTSTLLKINMIVGLCYAFVIYYNTYNFM